MGGKSNYSKETKIRACEEYKNGKGTFNKISAKYGCSMTALRDWYNIYLIHGEDAFNASRENVSYNPVFKKQVADEYISGKISLMNIAAKYNISTSIVRRWTYKYNNNIEFQDYDPKGEVYIMKSRTTTSEERIEIVEWIIENNYAYKYAAEKYQINYKTLHKWTKKYLDKGPESLRFKKRGPKFKNSIEDNDLSGSVAINLRF
jgi:transposase-like protein